MFVYRVENEGGHGPYRNGDPMAVKLSTKHDNNIEFPGIWADFDDIHGRLSYHCGCATLKDLKAWFKGFWSDLVREGYFIAIYRVPGEYVVESNSGKQIMFLKHHATRVKKKG